MIATAPSRILEGVSTPTWKSLRDCFKKSAAERRETNKDSQAASGIIEERGKRELLLDYCILEIDKHEEEKRVERDKKTEKERRLLAAGNRIRNQALRRSSEESVGNGKKGEGSSSPSQSATPSSKKNKRRMQYDSDGEDKQLMLDEIQQRRYIDSMRLKLEEERLSVEKSWKRGSRLLQSGTGGEKGYVGRKEDGTGN